MSNRVSALSSILRSPTRILGIVLMLVFTVEVAVMFVLPLVIPDLLGEAGEAVFDALLLTLVCAPALWWVIIGPLQRIAVQEHQRSETIVANASEGILTFDQNGWVISCNRAGFELFGLDAAKLVGQPVRSVLPDLPQRFETLPADYRIDANGSDGRRYPVHVSISEYPSETNQLLIAIVRDLTESERAEQERLTMARETEALRAQQMATLAQLATGVAHEIRNPLTAIKMMIQINRAKFAEEGLPTDDMELVEHEIRRMERSVNSLLDYARPVQTGFKEFVVQDVVRRAVQLIDGRCETQRVQLNVKVPDHPLTIVGDSTQIQQLILNLALNALDAMPDGGTLDLVIEQINDQVVLTMCDTGTGIDDTVYAKLFTPFVTTKPNGVGLGLGICRRIAESHQGTLVGTNRPTRGAKFQLRIPVQGVAKESQVSEASCKAC